ncbi:HNH endonuclease family protein [Streptomyces chartreusis]
MDVDHLVPLAETWDSGASQWTLKKWELYPNDLGDARDLISVSAASNWSKADKDPSEWLPPSAGYRCQYDTDWIADKTRWGLSNDAAERDALTQQLADCPDQPITFALARLTGGRVRRHGGKRRTRASIHRHAHALPPAGGHRPPSGRPWVEAGRTTESTADATGTLCPKRQASSTCPTHVVHLDTIEMRRESHPPSAPRRTARRTNRRALARSPA